MLVADLRQLNIRLDTDLAEQLKGMAAAEGLSLNQLIVRVLRAAAEQAPAAQGTVLERLAEIERRLDALEEPRGWPLLQQVATSGSGLVATCMDQEQRRSTRLSITVPASVIEGLARRAVEEGRSMSNLAAHLLAEHGRENGRED